MVQRAGRQRQTSRRSCPLRTGQQRASTRRSPKRSAVCLSSLRPRLAVHYSAKHSRPLLCNSSCGICLDDFARTSASVQRTGCCKHRSRRTCIGGIFGREPACHLFRACCRTCSCRTPAPGAHWRQPQTRARQPRQRTARLDRKPAPQLRRRRAETDALWDEFQSREQQQKKRDEEKRAQEARLQEEKAKVGALFPRHSLLHYD